MLEKIIHWLEKHSQPCYYKKIFGFDCPGCGLQRSIIELLRGNIIESLILYPALLPTIGLFVYTVLHLIFKFEKGSFYIKLIFILIVILSLTNYFYKIIQHNF